MKLQMCKRIVFTAMSFVYSMSAVGAEVGVIELRAQVPVACTIAISTSPKTTTLDVLSGENSTVVGTLTENCNASNGYVVQISSQNKGQLINPANLTSAAYYQAQYDNAEGVITRALVANRGQAQFSRQGKITISIPANKQRQAGTYSDTLNIIIAAK